MSETKTPPDVSIPSSSLSATHIESIIWGHLYLQGALEQENEGAIRLAVKDASAELETRAYSLVSDWISHASKSQGEKCRIEAELDRKSATFAVHCEKLNLEIGRLWGMMEGVISRLENLARAEGEAETDARWAKRLKRELEESRERMEKAV